MTKEELVLKWETQLRSTETEIEHLEFIKFRVPTKLYTKRKVIGQFITDLKQLNENSDPKGNEP
jgi:hypothetical protein